MPQDQVNLGGNLFKAIVSQREMPVVAAAVVEKVELVLIVYPQVLPAVPGLAARPGMASRPD